MDGTGQETLPAAPAHAYPQTGTDDAILYVLACPLPGQAATPAYLLHQVGGVGLRSGPTDLDLLVDRRGEHQPWAWRSGWTPTADLRDQQLPGTWW